MLRFNRWANSIDDQSLTLLLRYTGEFGATLEWVRLEAGSYPVPRATTNSSWQLRMHGAVLGIAMVYGCEFEPVAEPCYCGEPFFSDDYRDFLSMDKRTAWACDLDAAGYEILMWNIGEFGFRALAQSKDRYAIPRFPDHPGYDGYLRVSLYNLLRVFEACIHKLYR